VGVRSTDVGTGLGDPGRLHQTWRQTAGPEETETSRPMPVYVTDLAVQRVEIGIALMFGETRGSSLDAATIKAHETSFTHPMNSRALGEFGCATTISSLALLLSRPGLSQLRFSALRCYKV